MRKLVVLGSIGFCEEVADIAAQAGRHELAAYVENADRSRCNQRLHGTPVVWIDEVQALSNTHEAICGLGSRQRRDFVLQAEKMGFTFADVRHPTACISPTARVGPGCVVGANVVVAAHSEIGGHVSLNRGALIGHHTQIGDFVTISPGANVGGSGTIGDGTWIGIGATILDRIAVGSRSVVGAGAVVTKDVPDRVQVLGVPARITRTGVDGR